GVVCPSSGHQKVACSYHVRVTNVVARPGHRCRGHVRSPMSWSGRSPMSGPGESNQCNGARSSHGNSKLQSLHETVLMSNGNIQGEGWKEVERARERERE